MNLSKGVLICLLRKLHNDSQLKLGNSLSPSEFD